MAANGQVMLRVGYFITASPELQLGFVDEIKNFYKALFIKPELKLLLAFSLWLNFKSHL